MTISGHDLTEQQYAMFKCACKHWANDFQNQQLGIEQLLHHWYHEISHFIPLYSVFYVHDLLIEIGYYEREG